MRALANVRILLAITLGAMMVASTSGAIEFDCLELPADPLQIPDACLGLEWCDCLTTELSTDQGGEPAGILQAHMYGAKTPIPGALLLVVDGGTLHMDRIEVGDVIGRFTIDTPSGEAENFVLDFAMRVTEVDAENFTARFDIVLENTNETSKAILTYDPEDAIHAGGLLFQGTVESFGEENGFQLEYQIPTELPLGAESWAISDGDLTDPNFSVPVLVKFFDPVDFAGPDKPYNLPLRGGLIVIETTITQVYTMDITREFSSDHDVVPGIVAEVFRRGDVDGNGLLEITDAINNLEHQFLGSFDPTCFDALDFDDNGLIEITDPVNNLGHQFLGDPPPPAPGAAACGPDPTADGLGPCGEVNC